MCARGNWKLPVYVPRIMNARLITYTVRNFRTALNIKLPESGPGQVPHTDCLLRYFNEQRLIRYRLQFHLALGIISLIPRFVSQETANSGSGTSCL